MPAIKKLLKKPKSKVIRSTASKTKSIRSSPRPLPGLGKGTVLYIAPDFDAPMKEFREYAK
jgi:hypothetical protein